MIRSIHLHNIQSHENTHINLTEGINVIVGLSDAGKSAILRGLLWLITGRPLGDSLKRRGTKEYSVTIELAEGIKITKRRTNTENQYIVEYIGKKPEILNAVGYNVPPEIEQILNIDLHTQVQRQKARPFLLDESPGDVSKFINEITHLTDIDEALKFLNSNIRKNQSEQKRIKEEKDRLKDEYKSLWWVETLLGFTEQIEIQENNLYRNQQKETIIFECINKSESIIPALKICNAKASVLNAAKTLYNSHQAISSRKADLDKGHALIWKSKEQAETFEIAKMQALFLKPAKAMNEKYSKIKAKKKACFELSILKNRAKMLLKEIEKCKDEKRRLLNQVPKICPECGQPIPH